MVVQQYSILIRLLSQSLFNNQLIRYSKTVNNLNQLQKVFFIYFQRTNIIIMKNTPRKRTQFEGNSQFTRSKLESEYNPKYRTVKQQLMSFQELSSKDTHDYRSKEENQICEKAVQQIKKGSNLVIDWTTKTNFRTANFALPKIKTQPQQLQPNLTALPQNMSIQRKRIQLAKLLHVRHSKHYLQTKRQQEQEKKLFGTNKHQRGTRSLMQLTNRKNKFVSVGLKHKDDEESIEKVQTSIMKTSKLQILKDQLKAKFAQIRNYLQKSSSKSIKNEKKKGFFR